MSTHTPLTLAGAEHALSGRAVVPCVAGTLAYMKELRDKCLAAGLPAIASAGSPGGGCCGPKASLLVGETDVPAVAKLLQRDWQRMLEREGVAAAGSAPSSADGEHTPCPACGTAAPLVDGACSDCGLQLDEAGASGCACSR